MAQMIHSHLLPSNCLIQTSLLDSISEDDETYEDAYCPVQVPHLGFMLEHFCADEDGEPHDSPHQGVESWKEDTAQSRFFFWKLVGWWQLCRLSVGIQPWLCSGFSQTPAKSPADVWYWPLWPLAVNEVSGGVIDSWNASNICHILKGHLLQPKCNWPQICSGYERVHYVPSVMRARLVSTLPSMNLITARMMHTKPLTMDTLNRNPSWETDRSRDSFMIRFIVTSLVSIRV